MKDLKKIRTVWIASIALFILQPVQMNAQEKIINATDTIYPLVESLQSDMNVLKRLKVTGYIQAQYQHIDTAGMDAAFAGGNFAKEMNNRFMIRRGRIKFAYDNELSQYVLQFDVTEKGLAIKDAYVAFTDPWVKAFSIWGGVFNRPFGYEIEYSSSNRESPERSRIYQTLFPGERDLGVKLVIQPWKTSRFNSLKFDIGLFNGNGPNVETDQYKDLIAHLTFNKTFLDEKLKIGLGASYYNGGFRKVTRYVYSMKDVKTYNVYKPATGVPADTAIALTSLKAFAADSSGNIGDKVKREYYGVEAQLSYDGLIGLTTIRGEYLAGTQPGMAGSNTSLTALATGDVYIRKFSGYYFYFVQNIMQTPLGIVVKYDVYDPNTDVSGDEIAKASKEFPSNPVSKLTDPKNQVIDSKTGFLTNNVKKTYSAPIAQTGVADIKYSTLGLGLMYRWNSNLRITVYYDIVKNEITKNIKKASILDDYSKVRTDNVLTVRLQYKF